MATREPSEEVMKNWQQNHTTVLSTFTYLYNNPQSSDVTLIVGKDEQVFFAHKFYLSARSSIFESRFCHTKGNEISLPDVTTEGFDAILRYMYTDTLNLNTVEQAFCVSSVAKSYMMPYVEHLCQEYVISKICSESVFKIYEHSIEMHMPKVQYYCLAFIDKNISEIIVSPSFLKCRQSTVLMITGRLNLALKSEYELFKAVIIWSKNQHSEDDRETELNLRSVLMPFLPNIQFLAMYPLEFAKIVEEFDIFDTFEAFAILLKLLLPTTSVALPRYLNRKIEARKHFDNFIYYPFLYLNPDPISVLQINDTFMIKLQILKTDVFLLGITLPILLQHQINPCAEVETYISFRFINSSRFVQEYMVKFYPDCCKETYLAFPHPVLIEKNNEVEIRSKVQSIETSSSIFVFKYENMVKTNQECDLDQELISIPNCYQQRQDEFQIGLLRYYY